MSAMATKENERRIQKEKERKQIWDRLSYVPPSPTYFTNNWESCTGLTAFAGNMHYDETTGKLMVFNGTQWVEVV